MNQTIKQQWVEALRSGTYVQTYGALRTEEGYCVIGVLCDLHSRHSNTAWEPESHGLYSYTYLDLRCMPAPQVQAWAGLTIQQASECACHNDDEVTFQDLADYIDVNL